MRPPLSFLLAGLVATVVVGSGCPKSTKRGSDLPPRDNRIRSGHAPTPFSAEQIRQGCPDGHFRRYRIDIPGKPVIYRVLRFEKGTKQSAGFISQQLDAKGRPLGEQRRTRAAWKALQSHASFPASATRIRTVPHATPAGAFTCWLYEVRTTEGGRQHLKRFWFAKSLPGPPVQFDHLVDGKRAFSMVLVTRGQKK